MNKQNVVYNVGYNTNIILRGDEDLLHAITWMNLENKLNGVS